jgi:hypothetical protein
LTVSAGEGEGKGLLRRGVYTERSECASRNDKDKVDLYKIPLEKFKPEKGGGA